MDRPGRYLSDAWYADYSAGNLSLGEQVLLSAHLDMSPDAAERVARFDDVGGVLLASMDASGLKTGPLGFSADDIFDMDDAPAGEAETRAQVPSEDYVPPALQTFLDDSGQSIRWSLLGPGLRKCMLWQGEDGARLWMLRAQPGVSIPHHGHNGSELTLVLKGAFSDGDDVYSAGDVEEADGSIEHAIQIQDGEECICLALTYGKLRYDNPLLKVFQVFTGL